MVSSTCLLMIFAFIFSDFDLFCLDVICYIKWNSKRKIIVHEKLVKETEKQHGSSKIIMDYNHECMNGANIYLNIRIFENIYIPGRYTKIFMLFIILILLMFCIFIIMLFKWLKNIHLSILQEFWTHFNESLLLSNTLCFNCVLQNVEEHFLLRRSRFYFGGLQNHCKSWLKPWNYKTLLERKVMTNLGSILKSKCITLPTKVYLVKNWCFLTVVLEQTLKSPLDCKEIQPVHPNETQSWIFIGGTDVEAETPVLRPPDVKNWLIGKDPDAGKDWKLEEKGMIGWDGWMASLTQWTWVWINSGSWWWTGRPGVLQSMGSQRVGHNWVSELNWTDWGFVEWRVNGFVSFVTYWQLTGISFLQENACVLICTHRVY